MTSACRVSTYWRSSTASQDRRAQIIKLTEKGRREFRRMAKDHSDWIAAYFEMLAPKDAEKLMDLLGKLKQSARQGIVVGQKS